MKIVLLSGWSQAGKDTLGSILVAEHGFKRFAFADAAKDVAAKQYGFDRALADTQEGKQTVVAPRNFFMPAGRTVRDWVIYVAEEGKKIHGGGVWADAIADRIKGAAAAAAPSFQQKHYVITDWRFPEELVALQKAFPEAEFYPVRLIRPGQRVSPVGSITEYALSGFPMPSYNVMDKGSLKGFLTSIGCAAAPA
jgi:hypothetical protein